VQVNLYKVITCIKYANCKIRSRNIISVLLFIKLQLIHLLQRDDGDFLLLHTIFGHNCIAWYVIFLVSYKLPGVFPVALHHRQDNKRTAGGRYRKRSHDRATDPGIHRENTLGHFDHHGGTLTCQGNSQKHDHQLDEFP